MQTDLVRRTYAKHGLTRPIVQVSARQDIIDHLRSLGLVPWERKLAWFHRDTGQWLGERLVIIPAPTDDVIPLSLSTEARRDALNTYLQIGVPFLDGFTVEEAFDADAWDACARAVCVDVTRFGWPTGDHVYHDWDDVTRFLDWPERCVRKYIEVRLSDMQVINNQTSHRPIRDNAGSGQVVFDITNTPYAAHHGDIFGQFVWTGTKWTFVHKDRKFGRKRIKTAPRVRKALMAASVPDTINAHFKSKEKQHARTAHSV